MSKALPIFEVETAKHTAQRIRELSGTVAKLSWTLDEALRDLRQADPEDILLYSELIGKVLIAQREADIFLTRLKTPEIVEDRIPYSAPYDRSKDPTLAGGNGGY